MGFINFVTFVVFIITVIFGLLEWNEKSIGQVLEEYPTLITPIPYTLYIWGLIYITIFIFLVWQLLPANSNNKYVQRLALPLILTCIAQALWAPAWCNHMLALSLVLMLNIFYHLFIIGCKIHSAPLLLRLPFSLWFGWITVSLLNSITILGIYGLQVAFLGTAAWALIAVGLAVSLAVLWSSLTTDPFYSAAICWALFGIGQRADLIVDISRSAYIAATFVGLHMLFVIARAIRNKKDYPVFDPEDQQPIITEEEIADIEDLEEESAWPLMNLETKEEVTPTAPPKVEEYEVESHQQQTPYPVVVPTSMSSPSSFSSSSSINSPMDGMGGEAVCYVYPQVQQTGQLPYVYPYSHCHSHPYQPQQVLMGSSQFPFLFPLQAARRD
jgi:benzodiazapine receptor